MRGAEQPEGGHQEGSKGRLSFYYKHARHTPALRARENSPQSLYLLALRGFYVVEHTNSYQGHPERPGGCYAGTQIIGLKRGQQGHIRDLQRLFE